MGTCRPHHASTAGRAVRRALLWTIPGLIAAAGMLAGCGSSSKSSPATHASDSNGSTTVTVATEPVLSAGDLYVALSKGYFTQHHLHVNFKPLNGGAAIVPALESGAVQIGESNIVSVLQGVTRGIKEPCFAGGAIDAGTSLLAGAKSGVHSVHDLSGKTVAVNPIGGANQVVLERYLAMNGVQPSSVHIIGVQYPDMPAALSSGRVAAELVSAPFSTTAKSEGATVLAANPQRSVTGKTNFNCWDGNASWLKSHGAEASEFAAAIDQAHTWIAAHPSGFRKLAEQHLKMSATIMNQTTLPLFSSDLTQQSIQRWAGVGKQTGLLTSTPSMSDVLVHPGA